MLVQNDNSAPAQVLAVTELPRRRVTYKLYPTKAQRAQLERLHAFHKDLYNAALQERADAWRLKQESVSFADQCKSLTIFRRDIQRIDIEATAAGAERAYAPWVGINAQSAQVTLKRADLAFQHFFRRVKAGETPGYPRFKSHDRFPGFGFKTHGDGFRFEPGLGWKHGRLRVSGVPGTIEARGQARTPGQVVCCDLQRKADGNENGGWFLSLVVACAPYRERTGEGIVAGDPGIETLLTLAHEGGGFTEIENDRLWAEEAEAIKATSRALSRRPGRRSNRMKSKLRSLRRQLRSLANRRKNRAHQLSARLAAENRVIALEQMALKNLTASAKGTSEAPGINVQQKAGLNRELLDLGLSQLYSMVAYKAEEADGRLILIDPKTHKPSQTCPGCGAVHKKTLSQRWHRCPDCGLILTRDQASALYLLRIVQQTIADEILAAEIPPAWITGKELAAASGRREASRMAETPTKSAA